MYLENYDSSKFRGPGNGLYIVKFIEQECPPLAWNMVSVKTMRLIVKNGLKATAIQPTDEFNDELLEEINKVLKSDYGTELPL